MYVGAEKTISSVPSVTHCEHVARPQFLWIQTEPNQAPEFCYSGFPESGRVVLSKGNVMVVCHRCARELNAL